MEKKRRMKRRGIATLLATALLVALMAIPAAAATTYTPVAGTSCTFNKYLIMDAGDSVPNVTFSFTIEAGTAISTDTSSNTVMEVMAGVGTPTIANITFAPGQTTYTTVQTGHVDITRDQEDRTGTAGTDTVQFDTGEKYAVKSTTVDFSSVYFTEPGIYRYTITETASDAHAAAGILHDTDNDRVLDVYVTDDGTGTLAVSSYVLHTDVSDVVINATMGSADVAANGDAVTDKTDGFTNEYTSKDLKIEKEVAGNQASHDKWFELTVTIPDLSATDSFVVSITTDSDDNTNDGSADATTGTTSATRASNREKANPTTVTGAQLGTGQKFYLQHGQYVVIRGLPLNANYTVTEDAEDYSSAVKDGDTNSGVIGTVAGNNKMATAGFTNTRSGIIPTGILLSATPWIILGLVVIAGIVFFAIRSRKKYEEE